MHLTDAAALAALLSLALGAAHGRLAFLDPAHPPTLGERAGFALGLLGLWVLGAYGYFLTGLGALLFLGVLGLESLLAAVAWLRGRRQELRAAAFGGAFAAAGALVLMLQVHRTSVALERLTAHLVEVTRELEAFQVREGWPYRVGRDGPDPFAAARRYHARYPGIFLRFSAPDAPVPQVRFPWIRDCAWIWTSAGGGWRMSDGSREGPCCDPARGACGKAWGPYRAWHALGGPDGGVPPLEPRGWIR